MTPEQIARKLTPPSWRKLRQLATGEGNGYIDGRQARKLLRFGTIRTSGVGYALTKLGREVLAVGE